MWESLDYTHKLTLSSSLVSTCAPLLTRYSTMSIWPPSAATSRGVNWLSEKHTSCKTNSTNWFQFMSIAELQQTNFQIANYSGNNVWVVSQNWYYIIGYVSRIVSYTYPLFIFDDDISSFVKKVFHNLFMSSFSCHVQGSPLIEQSVQYVT